MTIFALFQTGYEPSSNKMKYRNPKLTLTINNEQWKRINGIHSQCFSVR
jgi:hypothetical protein